MHNNSKLQESRYLTIALYTELWILIISIVHNILKNYKIFDFITSILLVIVFGLPIIIEIYDLITASEKLKNIVTKFWLTREQFDLYLLIIMWLEANFIYSTFFPKTPAPKLSFKASLKRLIYMSVALILPLILVSAFVFTSGHYSTEMETFNSNVMIVGQYNATIKGTLEVQPQYEENFMRKISYMFGNVLNIPIVDICFVNNGSTSYNTNKSGEINNSSFYSSVSLSDNSTYIVPYKGKTCFATTANFKQNINYKWHTYYEFNTSTSEGRLPLPNNRITLDVNSNYIILIILLLTAWIAICRAWYGLFKDVDGIN